MVNENENENVSTNKILGSLEILAIKNWSAILILSMADYVISDTRHLGYGKEQIKLDNINFSDGRLQKNTYWDRS